MILLLLLLGRNIKIPIKQHTHMKNQLLVAFSLKLLWLLTSEWSQTDLQLPYTLDMLLDAVCWTQCQNLHQCLPLSRAAVITLAFCRPERIFFLFLAFWKMQIVAVLNATGDCTERAPVQHQGILHAIKGKVTFGHLLQHQSYILRSEPAPSR